MSARTHSGTALFPLLLAGLLAGMTYWLDLASRPQSLGGNGKTRHDPDYIVQKFEVRRFDPEGALQHTLVAEEMRHYPDDDSTVVLAPRLTYHRTPPTYVSAREARIDSEGKHVELIDDVRVTRTGVGGKPDSVLTTARLHAWPDDETARTDAPVTITQGRSRVDGSGLEVNSKLENYVLEGPVRGIFFRDQSTMNATPAAAAPAKPARPPAVMPKAKARPVAKPKPKPVSKPKSGR